MCVPEKQPEFVQSKKQHTAIDDNCDRATDRSGELTATMETNTNETESVPTVENIQAIGLEILDFVPEPILAVDRDHRVIAWNQMMMELTGIESKDILGRGNFEYALPFYKVRKSLLLDRVLDRYLSDESSTETTMADEIESFTVSVPGLGSSPRQVEATARVLRDAQGRVAGAVEVIRDVTEKKRIEKEKEQLQNHMLHFHKMEAIGRLAGGVAHDFNNLITAIMGNISLAGELIEDNEELSGVLKEVYRAADKAAALTRQLLAFSRSKSNSPSLLNLNDVIESGENIIHHLIGKNITLQIKPGKSIKPVYMDPVQFEQILVNLVVNARDAMESGGKLIVALKDVILDDDYCQVWPDMQAGEYVCLTVEDNGCGIEPDVLDKIFDPFFTTKAVDKGSGLGLATVYGIVKQSRGAITVESTPSVGSTFRVFFPTSDSIRELKPESIGKPEKPRESQCVLLVEDDSIIRQVAKTILQRIGYRVYEAGDGDEAIYQCQSIKERIDLLLTDIVLPECNGVELAKQLLEQRPEMKVIYTSGYTHQIVCQEGMIPIDAPFLSKPYSMENLAEKIHHVLNPIQ